MATQKKPTKKTSIRKAPLKKSPAKKITPKKRTVQKIKEPQLIFLLNAEGRLTIDRLKRWTRFVGVMNIFSGIMYCLTIFIFSLPTVIMGIVSIFMGTKLTIAANHLDFAKDNSDSTIVFIDLATEPMFAWFEVSTKTMFIKLLLKLICLLSSFPLQ